MDPTFRQMINTLRSLEASVVRADPSAADKLRVIREALEVKEKGLTRMDRTLRELHAYIVDAQTSAYLKDIRRHLVAARRAAESLCPDCNRWRVK